VSQTLVAPLINNQPETTKGFRPSPPEDFEQAGLNDVQIEGLVLKFLLSRGLATGRSIANELGLPFGPFPEFLRTLKNQQILNYSNALTANDFIYSLTETGRTRAKRYHEECSYVGPAPVPFEEYVASVAAQSITLEQPKKDDLLRAFEDLMLTDEMLDTLGPAINSGRGFFLYGSPGNGKSSIAERVSRCFRSTVWIPKVIDVRGDLVRLFDLSAHEPVEKESSGLLLEEADDQRWIEIRRPRIVAGGELRMEDLEIHFDPVTKMSEAPLQMKSNNGTLLIDDFGRQRMPPIELLNRWIVPLEKRYDFLTLSNGKQIQVPFDQLILFSTNLEPRQLVDEAFLRRIPYKIEAVNPNEAAFRKMFEMFAHKLGFTEVDPAALDHLIKTHYLKASRPFRACHPRDLLLQVRSYCIYNDLPLEMKREYFDHAAKNYFTTIY